MSSILARLGETAFRKRWLVLVVWLLVLVGSAVAMLAAPSAPDDDFSMPGTESQKTFELLADRFPGMTTGSASATMVFTAPDGALVSAEPYRTVIDSAVAGLSNGEQVDAISNPFEENAVSDDGSAAYATVTYGVAPSGVDAESRASIDQVAQSTRESGLTVDTGGDALEAGGPGGTAEIIAIGLAALILFVTLGSIVAAGLPLLTALVGVGISMLTLTAVSSLFGLSFTTTTLALMLGLAVGIDYALFVVARYREERARGFLAQDAVRLAVGTAGSAVVFAGFTVVIALAGLTVVGMPMLTKMGLAAAGAVIVAIAVALTLVPAAIGFVPDRVLPRSARRVDTSEPEGHSDKESERDLALQAVPQPAADHVDTPADVSRWARFVLARPIPVLVLGVAILGALAIPAAGLRLGMPGDESRPTSETQRRAFDSLAEGFGPGINGPLMIVVDADNGNVEAAAASISERIAATDGIVSVSPAMVNDAGNTALFEAVPSTGPTDKATTDLVNTLRGDRSDITSGTDATFTLTGTTAINIDLANKMQDALVPYLAIVVGMAVLLLIIVFRSILVPIKAALGFLLSVLAALGAVVLVFQNGVLGGLFGVEVTGPIMSAVPIFMIGVVFGLAMDYEVFLVSRQREAFVHGHEPKRAIEIGMQQSMRVIVAAALIMIAVFAGFVTEQDAFIKMLGFSLAVAVLFDAFVVRLAIVPAVMALLDRRAWWIPGWLDRILPDVDIEGNRLERTEALKDSTATV